MMSHPNLNFAHLLYTVLFFAVLVQAHETVTADTASASSAASTLGTVAAGVLGFICCGGCCCCRRRSPGDLEQGEGEEEREGFPYTLPETENDRDMEVPTAEREGGDKAELGSREGGVQSVQQQQQVVEEMEAPPPAYKSVWSS